MWSRVEGLKGVVMDGSSEVAASVFGNFGEESGCCWGCSCLTRVNGF